jgi:hypothetical protein
MWFMTPPNFLGFAFIGSYIVYHKKYFFKSREVLMEIKRTGLALLSFMFLFAYLCTTLSVADSLTEEDIYIKPGGPIPIRNQMPLYLFYLQMAPDKASVIDKNEIAINADYTVSNVTVSAFTPATSLYDIQIDMEVSRITVDLRYGLYDNLEVGLEIPYIGLSSGYMDQFVEDFEDGISARTPRSRQRQGSYEFDYTFIYNNEYLINERTSKKGIGDMVFNAKYLLVKEAWYWIWPNISVRSAIKFPTADKSDLIGSGEFDYGFGVLIDKSFFDRLFVYLGGNVVMIKRPSVFSTLSMNEEIYSGMIAVEYFFTKRFSVIAESVGNSTPYPHSDTNPLDNDAYDWALGFNYRLKEKTNISWNFAVVENISAASSPDVSFHTGLDWRF